MKAVASNRRQGLTLVELLVVVAVLLVIAGILLPVFSEARERSLLSVDTSNLRQIGLAQALYTETYGKPVYGLQPIYEAGLIPANLLHSQTDTTGLGLAIQSAFKTESDIPWTGPRVSYLAYARRTWRQQTPTSHSTTCIAAQTLELNRENGAGWLLLLFDYDLQYLPSQVNDPLAHPSLTPTGTYLRLLLDTSVARKRGPYWVRQHVEGSLVAALGPQHYIDDLPQNVYEWWSIFALNINCKESSDPHLTNIW